jgi:hypothetical protein
MENINALYKALEQADADGNTAVAQQLADQIRTLSTEETTVEKPVDVTQPLTTKPIAPAATEDINTLYKALEQADASGDTALAQQLADKIRSLPTEEQSIIATQPQKDIPQQKPEDVGFLARAKESLKEGLTSFGGIKRGYELGSAKDRGDLATAATKMQEIKTRAEQPVTPTLTATDINRIAHEKGLLPAGAQVPSYIVEQVLKSGPEMAVPILTSLLVGTGTAMVTGPFAPVAAPIAATVAGIGSYGLQQYGHFMETQGLVKKAPEDLDPNQARVWAAITAPIGFIVDKFVAGVGSKFGQKAMLSKITEEIAKRKAAGEGVKTAIAKEVGKAAGVGVAKGATEMPTEMLEQAAEIIQAGGDISTEESKRQLFEAGWAGLAVGSSVGSAANAYSKYKEFKTEQQQEVAAPDTTTEKRPSRETLKRQFLKNAEAKANEINKAKVADINLPTITQTGADADQGKLFNVVGGPSVEVGKPIIVGALDDTTLTSWGLGKNSKAYKKLIGKDVSLPDNRALLDEALEEHPGKINEQAVDTYKSLIEQQETEAPDGRLDLGTTRISDAVLGGQKYGTPSGIAGRYGPTTDISGGITRVDQAGKTDVNAPLVEETKPLETIKGPEAKAKPETLKGGERLLTIQELLNDPNPQQRKAARRKFIELFKRDETNELIKEGAKLEREERAKYANLKKTQYPIVDQSTNLANILETLQDKPNYLIQDLRNPNVLEAERNELNQNARDYLLAESLRNKFKKKMTVEERAALEQEGEAVAKAETALPTEEMTEVEDQFALPKEEPLEARGQIEETGETPESIEGTFQKQYGKNVRLAKQRGLLNFLKDASELPPEIGQVSPTTKAVYYKGKGYFITNRITKENAPRMLLHEIGVHYGLEGMLGSANYKRIVKQIKQNHLTDKELKAAWDNTLETYPELAENSDNFMQEVIAKIGETAPNNTIFRQIVGYIKQFLSKLGYGWDVNKITVDDIRDMVQQSVRMSLAGKIKSIQPDLAMASEETGAPRPTYYSALSRVITNAQFKNNVSTQSGEQWVNWLNSKTSEAGVKRDELEFSGLLEFLELNQSEKFNKQDILNYLNDNGTKVNEYMYGEGEGSSYSDKDKEEWVEQGVSEYVDSKLDNLYSQAYEQAADNFDFPYYVKEENVTDADGNKAYRVYMEGYPTSPIDDTYYFSEDEAQEAVDIENNTGIESYAEEIHDDMVAKLYAQAEAVREELADQWDEDHENVRTRYLDWTLEGGDKKYTEVVIALQNPKKGTVFSHQHWPDISNPIVHYRVNARLDTKGNNVLFVEEIQSDWAQAPKKLRKKHITELAEKFKVNNNSPFNLRYN